MSLGLKSEHRCEHGNELRRTHLHQRTFAHAWFHCRACLAVPAPSRPRQPGATRPTPGCPRTVPKFVSLFLLFILYGRTAFRPSAPPGSWLDSTRSAPTSPRCASCSNCLAGDPGNTTRCHALCRCRSSPGSGCSGNTSSEVPARNPLGSGRLPPTEATRERTSFLHFKIESLAAFQGRQQPHLAFPG